MNTLKFTLVAALAAGLAASAQVRAENAQVRAENAPLRVLDPKTATEAECRAVLAEMLASTNDAATVGRVGRVTMLYATLTRRNFAELRAEADAALAAKGVSGNLWPYVKTFPKMSALARARNGADAAYAKSLAVAARFGADMTSGSILTNGGTLDDVAVLLSEYAAFPKECCLKHWQFGAVKKTMQTEAVKAVKRHIRSQGKSFITKDGVNPCEAYMTALNAALNAPRFAGLDAWLKGVGLKGVDLSALPTEAEVAKLRADALNGDAPLDVRNKAILYVCLGVEGYNAFVREFNGEE